MRISFLSIDQVHRMLASVVKDGHELRVYGLFELFLNSKSSLLFLPAGTKETREL